MEWAGRLPKLVEDAEVSSGRTDLWFSSTELATSSLEEVVESHTGWSWDDSGDALEVSLYRQAVSSDAASKLRSLAVSIRHVASKLHVGGVLELGHVIRRGVFRNASRIQVVRIPLHGERRHHAEELRSKAAAIRADGSASSGDLKWLHWYDNPRSGFQDHEVKRK